MNEQLVGLHKLPSFHWTLTPSALGLKCDWRIFWTNTEPDFGSHMSHISDELLSMRQPHPIFRSSESISSKLHQTKHFKLLSFQNHAWITGWNQTVLHQSDFSPRVCIRLDWRTETEPRPIPTAGLTLTPDMGLGSKGVERMWEQLLQITRPRNLWIKQFSDCMTPLPDVEGPSISSDGSFLSEAL